MGAVLRMIHGTYPNNVQPNKLQLIYGTGSTFGRILLSVSHFYHIYLRSIVR